MIWGGSIRGDRLQSLIGFNVPSLRAEQIAECIPELLKLISQARIKLFASTTFPPVEARKAFEAVSNRQTIGKVVLTP